MFRVVWSEGPLQMHHDKQFFHLSVALETACELMTQGQFERNTVGVYSIPEDRKPHENVQVIMLMRYMNGAWQSAYKAPLPRSRHMG